MGCNKIKRIPAGVGALFRYNIGIDAGVSFSGGIKVPSLPGKRVDGHSREGFQGLLARDRTNKDSLKVYIMIF